MKISYKVTNEYYKLYEKESIKVLNEKFRIKMDFLMTTLVLLTFFLTFVLFNFYSYSIFFDCKYYIGILFVVLAYIFKLLNKRILIKQHLKYIKKINIITYNFLDKEVTQNIDDNIIFIKYKNIYLVSNAYDYIICYNRVTYPIIIPKEVLEEEYKNNLLDFLNSKNIKFENI